MDKPAPYLADECANSQFFNFKFFTEFIYSPDLSKFEVEFCKNRLKISEFSIKNSCNPPLVWREVEFMILMFSNCELFTE